MKKSKIEILKRAQKEKWAIGQFNFSSLEVLEAIIGAAKNFKSPVIIGTSEEESKFFGLKKAVALKRYFEEETGISLILNLDHGQSLDYIKKAIGAGYDAVHFDGSKLPLRKNIAVTKKVVSIAKKKKVMVEGEVGIIGGKLTEAKEVEEFVNKTKVDTLAVNIGTWHGLEQKTGINFQRLKEIKAAVKNTPLVLHGGSGVPPSSIKKAIKMGVAKININTDLRIAFTSGLKKALWEKPQEIIPYKYLPEVILEVQKTIEQKIKLFGSQNRL